MQQLLNNFYHDRGNVSQHSKEMLVGDFITLLDDLPS